MIDIRPYLYYARIRIILQLTYRMEVFASLILNLIPLSIMVFMWRSVYSGKPPVAGVGMSDMITYSILALAIKDVFYLRTQDIILENVRTGSVALELMRPGSFFARLLADDMASSLVALCRRLIPLVLVGLLLFQPPWPHSFGAFSLFLVSVTCAYFILWLLSLMCGLLAFWFMELGNLGMVKDAVVKVFSGSIIPLWLFPTEVQQVSAFLPFQYTYQTPLGIYIGKTSSLAGLQQIGLQILWVGVLGGAAWALWSRAKHRLVVQGG